MTFKHAQPLDLKPVCRCFERAAGSDGGVWSEECVEDEGVDAVGVSIPPSLLLLLPLNSPSSSTPPTPSYFPLLQSHTPSLHSSLPQTRTTTLHSTRNNCFCLEGVWGGGKGGAHGSLCGEKGVFEGQLVTSPFFLSSSCLTSLPFPLCPSLASPTLLLFLSSHSSLSSSSFSSCLLSFPLLFFLSSLPLLSLSGPADVICHT